MVVKIVIGANFGDEGKGLMTDYFCHQSALRGEKCLVVLHNGGAQRGHTVVTPDGNRHVFHHFGSGTFAGSDTYLSEDFILNPMVFREEWEEIKKLCVTPKVIVSPNCLITTPFDMILNQMKEEERSENRHGSCGLGIYETATRQYCNFMVRTWRHDTEEQNKHHVKWIRDNYFLKKIESVRTDIFEKWRNVIYSDSMIDKYVEDMRFMFSHISIIGFSETRDLKKYGCLVFEGGQGLLLDQNNKEYFPNLTPSNTGLTNPMEIIHELGCFPDIEACYVTRTYLTRHGAGRLDGECDKAEINPDMQDLTNVPNPHQGALRYAKLNEKSLEERILKDFKQGKRYGAKISLAVTHENEYADMFSDEFKEKFDCIYYSNGETRKSVRRLK